MPRVLVIDDAKAVRDAIQDALDPLGLEIVQADGGAAGLQQILRSPWDLIFLDLEMPVMDGPAVLRLVRSRGITTPVVLATAVSSTNTVVSALRLGAASHIVKPFTAAEIRAAATKILKLERLPHDVAAPQVLTLASDATLTEELGRMLPANVLIDSVPTLADLVDFAEAVAPDLVLIEEASVGAQREVAPAAIRATAPTAGIFLVREGATLSCAPTDDVDGVDGVVPRALSEALVHDLFYVTFLRPVVFVEGDVVRAAAFQGAPALMPAYFGCITRHLIARCSKRTDAVNTQIDLSLVPQQAERVASLIATVNQSVVERGVQAWFTVAPELAALKQHPKLQGVPIE